MCVARTIGRAGLDHPMRAFLPALTIAFLACGFAAVLEYRRGGSEAPHRSLAVPSDWEWLAAEPGANLYVGRGAPEPSGSAAFAWIRRERLPSLASVGGDALELRQIDCQRRRSRLRAIATLYRDLDGLKQTTMIDDPGDWTPFTRTQAGRILSLVCERAASPTPGAR
jgi:hypothetical protein